MQIVRGHDGRDRIVGTEAQIAEYDRLCRYMDSPEGKAALAEAWGLPWSAPRRGYECANP